MNKLISKLLVPEISALISRFLFHRFEELQNKLECIHSIENRPAPSITGEY